MWSTSSIGQRLRFTNVHDHKDDWRIWILEQDGAAATAWQLTAS
jgi:hypothetical protein